MKDSEQNQDKRARNVRRHIGERIARRRAILGMSQSELSRKFNVSRPTVSRYETGELDINAGDMPLLAELLGTTVFYFYMGLDNGSEQGSSVESVFMQALNAMNHAASELAFESLPEMAAKIAQGVPEPENE